MIAALAPRQLYIFSSDNEVTHIERPPGQD